MYVSKIKLAIECHQKQAMLQSTQLRSEKEFSLSLTRLALATQEGFSLMMNKPKRFEIKFC